jgi:hypothetical protein
MVKGRMATSDIVHVGKFLREKQGVKLYEPICSKMQPYRSLCYLFVTEDDITCKKCQAKVDKYPTFYNK